MHFVQNPQYGKDYKKGYIFFSYNTTSLISKGIALFSKQECECREQIPLSHCGVVTGKNECIEAALPGGVQRSNFIEKYVDPENIVVFLCKPKNINNTIAQAMKTKCRSHLGKGYAIKGVIGSALWNILGLISWGWLRKQRNIFNSEDNMYCSELCAEALIAGFPNRPGSLKYHPTNIYPTTLFNDCELFIPWKTTKARMRRNDGQSVIHSSRCKKGY